MSIMLSVTQLNMYLKSLIDSDGNMSSVFVTGEISNFTNHYRTGHLYFSLKDENAAVKAVMFRTAASRLRFSPENGMRVIVRGRVSIYERDGVYQIYVEDMQPDGAGTLSLAFEQLKKKLEAKGYFDASHKKPIPKYPERIAVITSPTGAAVRDIFNVLSRRFPYAEIVVVPVQVQGDSAAGQIARAIETVNRLNAADVIITGRGGGSIEDLWAFNEEIVADAVYQSAIPVISAVGHETDYTIADFTADLRAPTPSAAAELAVPDTDSLLAYIDSMTMNATGSVNDLLFRRENSLLQLKKLLSALSVENKINDSINRVKTAKANATAAFEKNISVYSSCLSSLCASASAMNPMRVIQRGYAVVKDKNGKIIRDVGDTAVGEKVVIHLKNGNIECSVERITEND